MQAVDSHKQTVGSSLIQGLIVFFSIAIAAALSVIVLGYMGILPSGGSAAAFGERFDGLSQRVVTENYRFAEEVMHVKAGETVRLVLNNKDRLPHSLDINEWDVHVKMPGSSQVTAEFTPDQPGVYRFYCGLPGHEEAGMVGTLIVE